MVTIFNSNDMVIFARYILEQNGLNNGVSLDQLAEWASLEYPINSCCCVNNEPTAFSFTVQPLDQYVIEGDTVTFTVDTNDESATYQWFFNSLAINGETNKSLTFTSVISDNGGEYYCISNNGSEDISSDMVSLTVSSIPQEQFILDNFSNMSLLSQGSYQNDAGSGWSGRGSCSNLMTDDFEISMDYQYSVTSNSYRGLLLGFDFTDTLQNFTGLEFFVYTDVNTPNIGVGFNGSVVDITTGVSLYDSTGVVSIKLKRNNGVVTAEVLKDVPNAEWEIIKTLGNNTSDLYFHHLLFDTNSVSTNLTAYGTETLNMAFNMVFDGNSWVAGSGSTSGMDFPNQIKDSLEIQGYDVVMQNFGVAGQTISQMQNDAVSQIDPLATTNEWLIGLEVVNTFGTQTSKTQETIYDEYLQYFLDRKLVYENVIAVTPIAQTHYNRPNWEAVRLYIRNRMISEFPSYGILVADVGGRSELSTVTSQYYTNDNIHPNDNGYAVFAEVIESVILAQ